MPVGIECRTPRHSPAIARSPDRTFPEPPEQERGMQRRPGRFRTFIPLAPRPRPPLWARSISSRMKAPESDCFGPPPAVLRRADRRAGGQLLRPRPVEQVHVAAGKGTIQLVEPATRSPDNQPLARRSRAHPGTIEGSEPIQVLRSPARANHGSTTIGTRRLPPQRSGARRPRPGAKRLVLRSRRLRRAKRIVACAPRQAPGGLELEVQRRRMRKSVG